ncbi:type II secretion system F family protein [Naasia lichenicola]|uniref:Type II secretion system protein F n=1 Tax=Naasia lichenicola TaxID=2565933 RepID=A0A4S4FEL3_9MICO|nr:type II secretion system F family protein [Naasia lichenicola]THG28531.1 type II secretion system protein F [Naasia lichenicola]
MTVIVGLLLAAGLLLALSPWLWPARRRVQRPPSRLAVELGDRLVRAGMGRVPLPAFLAISALSGVAIWGIAMALTGISTLASIAGLVGFGLPLGLVGWRAASRRKLSRLGWPDLVDHLLGSVRAGLALPDAVAALSTAGPIALRDPFVAFERDYRATGSFSRSLDDLKAALADPTADRILETLRMAREVGGTELTSVLRALSSNLRQEAAVRAEIEARQSWVANAARLGVAAPWLVLVLLCTRPEAAAAYDTPTGLTVLLAAGAISVVAYRLMLAIGKLPEERRWFR